MPGPALGRLLSFGLDGVPNGLLVVNAAREAVPGMIAVALYRTLISADVSGAKP